MNAAVRIYPPPAAEVAGIHADVSFPKSHPRDPSLPYVAINMVASLDGKVSSGGKSGSIGGPADREAMRTLRSKADAVMIGAGTLRAEKASLTSEGRRSPEPLAVLVSASLAVPIRSLLHAESERTIILTRESVGEPSLERFRGFAEVMECASDCASGMGHIDLAGALRRLKEARGADRILLEGGPGLNHGIISRGLASELFLTISPKILGGPPNESIGIVSGEMPDSGAAFELTSIHEAAGEVFLRYKIMDASGPGRETP